MGPSLSGVERNSFFFFKAAMLTRARITRVLHRARRLGPLIVLPVASLLTDKEILLFCLLFMLSMLRKAYFVTLRHILVTLAVCVDS